MRFDGRFIAHLFACPWDPPSSNSQVKLPNDIMTDRSIQPKRFNFRIRGRGRVLRTSKQVSDKTTAWFQHMLMPAQTICVRGGSNTHILCHPTTNLNRAWGYVPDQHASSLDNTRWHTSTEEWSRLHARSSHWSLVCHPMTHLNRRSHCPLR